MYMDQGIFSKIKESLRPNIILCEGKDWTDDQYYDYFLKEYASPEIIRCGDSFFYYKQDHRYIWIQDFCSESFREAYILLDKIIDMKKRVVCQVAITNIRILNIIIRKGFRIKDLKGYNYILER